VAGQTFEEVINAGYAFPDPAVEVGAAFQGTTTYPSVRVRIPLRMVNRHGLVAGATGTGKTKTLQVLTEQLSDAGVPVFLADIKGDISGLAAPAQLNDRITARVAQIGLADYAPKAFPVEFLTLDPGGKGVRLRASVSSFGPVLLAKVLELNDTQQSVLSLVFKYADDQKLPLLDLPDLRAVLNYLNGPDGQAAMAEYGGISGATVGVMIRKIVELEQQGAGSFFGEPEFDVHDLLRTTADGRGMVSVLELANMQDRPKLFSTFMMWMLSSLYHALPEVGDPDKPKLVFFFDEAHLLFDDASEAFLDQIELVARLIRSKGVGVYFVTQSPEDVPAKVLAQLGNRVQHALRAFTPDDQKVIDATARTFPVTDVYDVARELTSLGTGEALATGLSTRGVPMPTVHVVVRPPRSLMAQVDASVFDGIVAASALVAEYAADEDPESAKEILTARLAAAQAATAAQAQAQAEAEAARVEAESAQARARDEARAAERASRRSPGPAASGGSGAGVDLGDAAKLGVRVLTSSTTNTILRGVFGILTGSAPRTTKRRRRY
jgi:hypothetical protein